MIFSTNTEPVPAEFQVVYQRALASSHEAKTGAAGHHLPSLVQCSPSHPGHLYTRVPEQVHACALRHKKDRDHQPGRRQTNVRPRISFIFLFHLLALPFFELRDEPQSQLVSDSRRRPCAPHGSVRLPCTSAAGSTPAPRCVLTHFITSRRASPSITRPTALDAGEVHVGGVTRAPITPAPPAPMPDGSTVTLL